MKGWNLIMLMMTSLLNIWSLQRCYFTPTSMRTMQENMPPHQFMITHVLLVPLNVRSLIMSHHKRSTLLPNTRNNPVQKGISSRSILCFLMKILIPVTPSAGGLDAILNFRTSLSLPMIFWKFLVKVLVCILSIYAIHHTHVKAVGSAVAVERIFSGGQDMITLWQASLHPNTIWTLMLVKQHLHITRHAIDDLIGDE